MFETPTKQSSAARSGSASGPHSGRSAASARSGSATKTPRSDGAGRPIPLASSKAVVVKHRHSGKAAKHHGVESAERAVVKANKKKASTDKVTHHKANSKSEIRRKSDFRTKEAPAYAQGDVDVSSHQGGSFVHGDAMFSSHQVGNQEDKFDHDQDTMGFDQDDTLDKYPY